MSFRSLALRLSAPLSVIFGSAVGLLTTLASSRLLPPSEFITFATLLAVGQFTAAAGFEWLKQSILRFGNSSSCSEQELTARARILNGGYTTISVVFLLVAGASALGAMIDSRAWLGAAALMYATSQGAFDGVQAWARTQLRNLRFSALWFARAGIFFVVTTASAMATGSGIVSIGAVGVSLFICVVIACAGSLKPPLRLLPVRDLRSLCPYLRFGFLAALAVSLTAAVQPLFRSIVGLAIEPVGAAGAILAVDIAFKVMSIVGLSINVVVSQHTYRMVDSAGPPLREILEKIQLTAPLLLLVPAGCLFYFMQPAASQLVVPSDLQPGYMEAITYASFGGLASSTRLFCIDPLLLMARRARLTLIGPSLALVLLVVGPAIQASTSSVSIVQISIWYCLSAVCGLLVSACFAYFKGHMALPFRSLLSILLAVFVMMFVMTSIGYEELEQTIVAVLVGGICYAILILAFEGATLRMWIKAVRANKQRRTDEASESPSCSVVSHGEARQRAV
jgi:hypothetical protein